MTRWIRRPSPALVVACLALALSLSGWAYAAAVVPKNSVGTAQLKKNAVVSTKVKNGSLLAADFKAGQLPAGAKGDTGDKGDAGPPGISDVQVISDTGASNSNPKNESVICPAGKTVLGGGGRVGGPAVAQLYLSVPIGTTGWEVAAVEPVAAPQSWSLTAYAVCAKVA